MEVILHNAPLLAAVMALVCAQTIKPFIVLILERKFEPSMFITTGGMPSSHTAAVVALATATALIQGLGSTYFAISLVLGIRRAAGKQAEAINEWNKILAQFQEDRQYTPAVLKTMLGHSFPQVLGGVALGLFFGFFVPSIV